MISIVIPAFNEEKRIRPTLEGIASFLKKGRKDFEIIVVFDGSDGTPRVVREFAVENALEKRVRLLQFKKRLGKGGAIMEGFEVARGEIVFLSDADRSVPPEEMKKLLNALDSCDIAIGSRYLRNSKVEIPFVRYVFAFAFHLVVGLLFALHFKDTQCGFKAFKRNAVKKLLPLVKTKGFAWDVDVLVQARKLGLKVKEIPIDWRLEKGGSITYKNGLQTALKMFATLLKLRFS
jgi:glycosyltransferase involved in cell wall biosynthesis